MTGFALSRALSMIVFWRNGTSSAGHSTPRSPRATMKPSKAAITSSRFSIACGFSILAMTGRTTFSSRMMRRTSSTSAALRTKLRAMKSTVRCSANRRSSMSFSDSAGTDTATPGRLMPLWLLTFPPTSTSHTTSVPSLTSVDPKLDLAVVDEDRVARLDVTGEPLVRRPADLAVAVDLTGGDRPDHAPRQLHRPAGEALQPDLGPLEVGQDADPATARVRGLAHQPVDLGVVLLRPVAHVQPGDVHPGVHQLPDPPLVRGRRAQRADDLRSSHVTTP